MSGTLSVCIFEMKLCKKGGELFLSISSMFSRSLTCINVSKKRLSLWLLSHPTPMTLLCLTKILRVARDKKLIHADGYIWFNAGLLR